MGLVTSRQESGSLSISAGKGIAGAELKGKKGEYQP